MKMLITEAVAQGTSNWEHFWQIFGRDKLISYKSKQKQYQY